MTITTRGSWRAARAGISFLPSPGYMLILFFVDQEAWVGGTARAPVLFFVDLERGCPVPPFPALVVTLLALWAVLWLLSRWGGGL